MGKAQRHSVKRVRQLSGFPLIGSVLLLMIAFSSCTASDTTAPGQVTDNASAQAVRYDSNPQKVLIRSFYGGGLYGSFELAPQLSIYGDGTYIIGMEQEGKLSITELKQLLSTLINTHNLLKIKRQQFADIPDQNATFLELTLNGKQQELMYGSFGNRQESVQDMAEYHQLGAALTTITETLKGPTHSYSTSREALLVHQIFGTSATHNPSWPLTSFTLNAVASLECGSIPEDIDANKEVPCLKYTIPTQALLLDPQQGQLIAKALGGQQQGVLVEAGAYYTVTLRPLLPDEIAQKNLAMFGSGQTAYQGVPLHEGAP